MPPGPPPIGVISGVNAPAATAGDHDGPSGPLGITARTFELSWASYEPELSRFDEAYVARKAHPACGVSAQGFLISLDLGIHYPPPWVWAVSDGSRFRNQFGDTYTTDSPGKDPVNVIFDQRVRDEVSSYIGQVFAEFGTDFDAVRLGGLGNGELHFPDGGYNGHVAPLWAYDPVAQGVSQAWRRGWPRTPSPDGSTGDPDDGNREAAVFFRWYVSALANWRNWPWSLACRGAGYENSIYVLYGAYGMRDGVVDEVDNAIRAGLQNCLACDRQTLSSGQDWISLVAALPADPKVYPYTTWVDGPVDADDSSVDRSRWSPAKYLAWVAERSGCGRIGGENAGGCGCRRTPTGIRPSAGARSCGPLLVLRVTAGRRPARQLSMISSARSPRRGGEWTPGGGSRGGVACGLRHPQR